MSGKQLSYDYVNKVRSLGDTFTEIIKQNPVTSAILTIAENDPFDNPKMEWLEDVKTPKSWTMDQNHTASDGEIDISSTLGLEEGMIVEFEHVTTGKKSTLVAKVGTITTNDKFALTVYGGSADENILSGSIVRLIAKPKNEGTEASASEGTEPVAKYNFSQIFDRTAKVSRTALNTKMYGINKTPGQVLDYQVRNKLLEIAFEVASSTINMPRVERSDSEPGTMGGWLWFLKQASGNSVDANGANVTGALLNQAFESARSNGGMPSTIVAHPVQAKFISAINANKVIIERADTTAGQFVSDFVSDYGDRAKIVYSEQMDKDKIAVLTPSLIRMRPLQNSSMTDKDATPNGADYIARRIIGEYSLEVKNAGECHAYIYNLSAVTVEES